MKTGTTKQVTEKKSFMILGRGDNDPLIVTKPVTRNNQPFDDVNARISARAYELYMERGCREGWAEQDWLDAEREVLSLTVPS
ncbi:MAG: DUF2934 domain-containing protein [Nitrospira sp.]|nr:DUF2934 domain-containing protein [Nitrospira sp.]MBS0153407.1 DUF2934 domain-containing protein [Nitrospira sp.]MBS0165156.1 DUF2934 domain-containing protein [Nitrospira sp.]